MGYLIHDFCMSGSWKNTDWMKGIVQCWGDLVNLTNEKGMEICSMTLNFFKDILFELLNNMDEHILADIEADDRRNIFQLWMADGCGFEIECRKLNK